MKRGENKVLVNTGG